MRSAPLLQVLFAQVLLQVAFAEPVTLVDSLSPYFVGFELLDSGRVLFIDSDGDLCAADIDNPMSVEEAVCDWDPEGAGWSISQAAASRGWNCLRIPDPPSARCGWSMQVVRRNRCFTVHVR